MKISMPRGDLQQVIFRIGQVSGAEEPQLTEVYFTVKRTFDDREYLFQKRMTSGDIERIEPYTYRFSILPGDTDNLTYGKYVCDVELVGENIKQTTIGELVLTYEATHAGNE